MAVQASVGQQRHEREGGRNRTDAQAAGEPGQAGTGFLPQPVAVGQHPARPRKHPLAFWRKALKAPATPHNRQPELLFDAAHRARQRWLRDIAEFGGAAEVARLRKRDEVGQLPNEHRVSLYMNART
ncbi:hypothetical protein D3C81_755800 [compost metagenome]